MFYDFVYSRVYYPLERGYRMELCKLPYWLKVEIIVKDGSKYVKVHSRIHVNKEVVLNPSYSTEFSDTDILKDMSGKIANMFL